jgi:hypothetical protein
MGCIGALMLVRRPALATILVLSLLLLPASAMETASLESNGQCVQPEHVAAYVAVAKV